jgi:hypothetical protein
MPPDPHWLLGLNHRLRRPRWSPPVLVGTLGLTAAIPTLALATALRDPGLILPGQAGLFSGFILLISLVVLVAGLLIARLLARAERAAHTLTLRYSLSPETHRHYLALQYELERLSRTARAWQPVLPASAAEAPSPASPPAGRLRRLRPAAPPHLATGLPVRGLALPGAQLFFLPDLVLLLGRAPARPRRYHSFPYHAVFATSAGRHLVLSAPHGLRLHLDVDDEALAHAFAAALARYQAHIASPRQPAQPDPAESHPASPPPNQARPAPDGSSRSRQSSEARRPPHHEPRTTNGPRTTHQDRPTHQERPTSPDPYHVLGLQPGASPAAITAAYRRLAKRYHPDRAMAQAPPQRAAAEAQMKAINAAYAQLKKEQ